MKFSGGKMTFLILLLVLFGVPTFAYAEEVLVISEISPYGNTSKDEFIELYNPTDDVIDLTGWSLKKQTPSGRLYTLVSELSSRIEPRSYFVIAHKEGYEGDYIPDLRYTTKNSISSNNKIIFYDKSGEEMVSLAWGDIDGSAFNNPNPGESITFKDGEYVSGVPSPGSENNNIENEGIGSYLGQYFFQNGAPIVAINEVSPHDGGWVELFSNLEQPLSLDGWVLKSNHEEIILSGTIKPLRWFLHRGIVIPASKGEVGLYTPDGVLVDDVQIDEISRFIPHGASVIRKRDGHDYGSLFDFALTGSQTPGAANTLESVIPDALVQTELVDPNEYVHNRSVYISEVFPNPVGSDSDDEFIELHNRGEYSVEISGWILGDSSREYLLPFGFIDPDEYLVVYRIDSTLALNNSGEEEVFLFDNNKRMVDSVVYEGASEGISWNRGDTLYEQDPSPGRANNEFVGSPESGDGMVVESVSNEAMVLSESSEFVTREFYPVINEFLPNPAGSDSAEWVELYNPYDISISLDGLFLDDKDGGSRAYALSGVINAHAFSVISREESGIALNNTFDEVRLLEGESVIESVEYSGVIEGAAYARFEDDFFWTLEETTGSQNRLLSAEAKGVKKQDAFYSVDAAYLSQYEKGDRVRVQGVVTVLPGVLGSRFFYIDGAQVYSYKKDFPDLVVGEHVSVQGELSFVGGIPRVKTSSKDDVVIIDRRDDVYIESTEIGGITEEYLGRIVVLQGLVLEKQRNKLFLDDGTGEVVVYAKATADLSLVDYDEGDDMLVTGIVTKVGDSIEIQPRMQGDLVVASKGVALTYPVHTPITVVERSYTQYVWVLLGVAIWFAIYRLFLWKKKVTSSA